MITAEDLICEIEKEGVVIDNRDDIKTSFAHALSEDRFSYLYNASGQRIGFYTWCDKRDKILINNLFIYSQYRNRNNLLCLRDWFRSRYFDGVLFYWKNRKTGKYTQHY